MGTQLLAITKHPPDPKEKRSSSSLPLFLYVINSPTLGLRPTDQALEPQN